MTRPYLQLISDVAAKVHLDWAEWQVINKRPCAIRFLTKAGVYSTGGRWLYLDRDSAWLRQVLPDVVFEEINSRRV